MINLWRSSEAGQNNNQIWLFLKSISEPRLRTEQAWPGQPQCLEYEESICRMTVVRSRVAGIIPNPAQKTNLHPRLLVVLFLFGYESL